MATRITRAKSKAVVAKGKSRGPLRVVLHWHEKRRIGVLVDYAVTVSHPGWAGDTLKIRPGQSAPAGIYQFVCGQINGTEEFRVFLRTEPVESNT